jgi:hypothetical protein
LSYAHDPGELDLVDFEDPAAEEFDLVHSLPMRERIFAVK